MQFTSCFYPRAKKGLKLFYILRRRSAEGKGCTKLYSVTGSTLYFRRKWNWEKSKWKWSILRCCFMSSRSSEGQVAACWKQRLNKFAELCLFNESESGREGEVKEQKWKWIMKVKVGKNEKSKKKVKVRHPVLLFHVEEIFRNLGCFKLKQYLKKLTTLFSSSMKVKVGENEKSKNKSESEASCCFRRSSER